MKRGWGGFQDKKSRMAIPGNRGSSQVSPIEQTDTIETAQWNDQTNINASHEPFLLLWSEIVEGLSGLDTVLFGILDVGCRSGRLFCFHCGGDRSFFFFHHDVLERDGGGVAFLTAAVDWHYI